jgi:galactokinase
MDTPVTPESAKSQFAQVFGQSDQLHVVRAPGRVNLIGEHTDYNDGFVFPLAIEPQVWAVCRGREDGGVRFASSAFPGQIAEWSVDKPITPGEPRWANYCRGVTAGLLQAGIPLTGLDALLINTLPIGGGLSSSAAIEVATACCFLAEGGLDIDMQRLAAICQWAEHKFANVPCGIMDQSIVISARQDHAMLLDCRDLSRRFVPLDGRELRIVVINSNVKHELSGGEYAQRRRQCEEGVAALGKHFGKTFKALRDVTLEQVEECRDLLGDVVYRRCRHVVGENLRTTQAADLLTARRYEQVGQLMLQSHQSLRDDYEVSCPELDVLVESAMGVRGVYGARMTGGGFGGCIVVLAQPRAVEAIIDTVSLAYEERFHIQPHAFVTTAAAGASILE